MTTSDIQFEKFDRQLAEWKAQVAKLEAKAAGAAAEAKPAYLREVEELKEKFATVHDSPGSGGLIGPSRACTDPGIECLAGLVDDPVAQSIETSSEP